VRTLNKPGALASGGNSAAALSYATAGPGATSDSFPPGPIGPAGSANAASNATVLGPGQASAQATVFGGASAGAATATSTSGEGAGRSVSASGVAPVGGNASAQTLSSFGGSGFGLPGITAGTSISNVTGQLRDFVLTPNVSSAFGNRPIDALGAMSIGYGGHGESLTYQTSATFQFAHPANTDFLFGSESQGSLGTTPPCWMCL
jgi:hypothetical protein